MKRIHTFLACLLLALPVMAQTDTKEGYVRQGNSIGAGTTSTFGLTGLGAHYRYTLSQKRRLETNLGYSWVRHAEEKYLLNTFLDIDLNYQLLFPVGKTKRGVWYLYGGLTLNPRLYKSERKDTGSDHYTPNYPIKIFGIMTGGGYEYYIDPNWVVGGELKLPMWITAYFLPIPHLKVSVTRLF